MAEKFFVQAINDAIVEEMRHDESVFIMGEDIRKAVYGATANLLEEFGESRQQEREIVDSQSQVYGDCQCSCDFHTDVAA